MAAPAVSRGSPRARFIARTMALAYLAATVLLWAVMHWAGDRWWVGTVILFGPKWLWSLPLLFLIPVTWYYARRVVWALAVAGWVLLFPLMGFNVPLPSKSSNPGAFHIRVMTCNIHHHAVDIVAMNALLVKDAPDVVALQEWSSAYDALFADPRWHVRRDGELLLASRFPVIAADDLAQGRWGPAGSMVCYELQAEAGSIHVLNVHLASPHQQFADLIHRVAGASTEIKNNSRLRLEQSRTICKYATSLTGRIVIVGDFNTPSESSIFRTCFADFQDAFGEGGVGFGYSYYAKRNAVRIDHVLGNQFFRFNGVEAGADVGSPHRPLIVTAEVQRGSTQTRLR